MALAGDYGYACAFAILICNLRPVTTVRINHPVNVFEYFGNLVRMLFECCSNVARMSLKCRSNVAGIIKISKTGMRMIY